MTVPIYLFIALFIAYLSLFIVTGVPGIKIDIELEEVNARVTDAATKHLSVLDEVYEKVPAQAKASIQAAKERSMTGQIEALRGIAQRDPESAVDIFARAAEGRLMAAEARANRGGDDDEEAEDVEKALDEFNEYAEFGKEISTLAEGLQTGETTVEELVERATKRHLEILQEVQSKVPAQAQDGVERAMENAGSVQNLRPQIPTPSKQQGAPEDQGTGNTRVDTSQRTPSTGQGGDEEEEETEVEDEAPGAPEDAPIPGGVEEGRP